MQEIGFRGTFNVAQTKQLLAPIRAQRVLRDPRGNSHVSQQDITAHLIRVFGYGNFGTELLNYECIFETPHDLAKHEASDPKTKYTVAYRAHMRLTVFDERHNLVSQYEDASVGDAQNLVRQDAHDLALKSAISLAKKRCCINLGDQFGLSLYNKGQMEALVGGTHVLPPKFDEDDKPKGDLQEGVPKQESMGVDEVEKVDGDPDDPEAEQRIKDSLGGEHIEEAQQ